MLRELSNLVGDQKSETAAVDEPLQLELMTGADDDELMRLPLGEMDTAGGTVRSCLSRASI